MCTYSRNPTAPISNVTHFSR